MSFQLFKRPSASSGLLVALSAFTLIGAWIPLASNAQQESDESAMATYADAANFQTGGAIELAIDAWNQFLRDYPSHSMAPQAAHYLGVCHMQSDPPDYRQAAKAFDQAVQNEKYDLREESLANLGWCLYASAGSGKNRDSGSLRRVINTFKTLIDIDTEKRFLDRALFYSGEAAYGLGKPEQAIEFYDRLLASPQAKDSPLRCDALYARGVALEEATEPDRALASYEQLLKQCADSELATDVHMRLGDLHILEQDFDAAIESFERAIESAGASNQSEGDRAYALFRQGYALVQLDRPSEAAKKYDQLIKQFPQSPYAGSAQLASAQSKYRGGQLEAASKGFRQVLDRADPASATEAAHWLARIEIGAGDLGEAAAIARKQLARGAEGDYATYLKMDLAEALADAPEKLPESLELFEQAYREADGNELAPRALYNAAFSALQLGEIERAQQLSSEFLQKFPNDDLTSDVTSISAECLLAAGQTKQAAEKFAALVKKADPSDPQRPNWILRAAAAKISGNELDQAIRLIQREVATLPEPNQKAEALMMLGQAQRALGNASDAAAAYAEAITASPRGPRASEARLLQGQVLSRAGQSDKAVELWNSIVQSDPDSRMADQSRYQLAQVAAAKGNPEQAVSLYREILASDADPGLHPYAQYGIGFVQLGQQDYVQAAESLDAMLSNYASHPLRGEATLARGIAYRNLGKFPQATKDLGDFLETSPRGTGLGHALYELALIDVRNNQPELAAEKLQRVVDEVPGYPDMEKVLYELAWANQESGNEPQAAKHFASLVKDFPETELANEAAYFLGQRLFSQQQWQQAADQFEIAAKRSTDPGLREKAWYRRGWSLFKLGDYEKAETAFSELANRFDGGDFQFDGQMMIGECRFKQRDYPAALQAYESGRRQIQENNETEQTLRDRGKRQVRELLLLHGGQSAAQLKDWKQALSWYNELRERFPASIYHPQAFYEIGFAYQQSGDPDRALKFFGELATSKRNELAARSRFMMGEIHFAERRFDQAILEFKRVMFGFNAEQAPENIKNWQAKSGFEAGRCSELLIQVARTEASREKASQICKGFYTYVVQKHPNHELAQKSRQRIEALQP